MARKLYIGRVLVGQWGVPARSDLRYHPSMMFRSQSGLSQAAEEPQAVTPFPAPGALYSPVTEEDEAESTLIKTIGWISAALGAVAFGLFVGREIRQRYKFKRRTPYDFYSHSGEGEEEVDGGLGI